MHKTKPTLSNKNHPTCYTGGDINTVDEFGQSPVVTSALYSQPKVAAYLIEQGAQLDLRDKVGVPAVVVVNAKYPGLAANMLDR